MMKCLIFDCDGTLVDSECLCSKAFTIILKEFGINEPAPELVERYRGWKLAAIIESLEQKHGFYVPDDFEARYRKLVATLFQKELQEVPYMSETLSQLNGALCVASSGPKEKINDALRITGLLPFFGKNIFSSYDIQSWKPEPGVFLHAAGAMGFDPQDCVVIEDSPVGVTAGLAAGMKVIQYDPSSAVSKYTKNLIRISSMQELVPAFEQI